MKYRSVASANESVWLSSAAAGSEVLVKTGGFEAAIEDLRSWSASGAAMVCESRWWQKGWFSYL